MVFVAGKDPSHLVQGAPSGDLQLRILGSCRDGQVVRLSAAKCTIGSAEGCTLRLRARGVWPVHMLILRGTNGTVARSWAPRTLVNGQPFRDVMLEPGDRLSIGPVELEVLPTRAAVPAEPFDAGRTMVLDRGARSNCSTASQPPPARRIRRRERLRKLVNELRRAADPAR